MSCCCDNGRNSRSACALKDIIDRLDDLDDDDLRILDELLDRIISCRSNRHHDC